MCLSACVQASLQNGFEIMLSLDANENMRKGKIKSKFKALGLVETTSLFTTEKVPTPFTRGKH